MDETEYVDCDPGWFCSGGAKTKQPDGEGGNRCPTGHYCEIGTGAPVACAPGTYNPVEGGVDVAACLACPANYYCESYGAKDYELCAEGFFCEASEMSSRPTGKYCPIGHFCTSGRKEACTLGTYQDKVGSVECVRCPAGYKCEVDANGFYSTLAVCGQNHYC